MRPYFEGLRADTVCDESIARPPPARGLDNPANVAAFIAWLLTECPAGEFATRDWDIQDASHHRHWCK